MGYLYLIYKYIYIYIYIYIYNLSIDGCIDVVVTEFFLTSHGMVFVLV